LLIDGRCSEIASFKTDVLDRMSKESTISQCGMILSFTKASHYPRHFSFFAGGLNGVAEFPCAIIWDAALTMLSELHESSSRIEDSVENFPKKLTELRSSTFHVNLGCHLEPETRDSWLVSMLFQVSFRALIRESFKEHSFV